MLEKFVLTNYIENAISKAVYDKLEDGSFFGKIQNCQGVIAFGKTLKECQIELRSTLEDWIFVGLKLKYKLPVIEKIDVKKEKSTKKVRTAGSLKGFITYMADDFDAPLDDFKDYM